MHTSIRRHVALPKQVHAALRERIVTRKIGAGERLVVEHLAEQFGVSPTPVREALSRLTQEGLASDEPSGKLQVVSLTPRYVSATFLVRAALEGLAAELAAPRIQQEQLLALRDSMARVDEALTKGDYDVYAQTDQLLHRSICEAADNDVLSRELYPLQVHVDFIRAYSRRHAGDHIQLSHREHWVIVDALERRDPGAARCAMEEHIRNASHRIVKLIDFDVHQTRADGVDRANAGR